MADLLVLSPSKLHRMVPSTLEELKKRLRAPGVVDAVREAFEEYLALLDNPQAAELDDVTRIALQLSSIGFWRKVHPEDFIRDIRPHVDNDVVAELHRALKLEPEVEAATSVPGAVEEERPFRRSRISDKVGFAVRNFGGEAGLSLGRRG